MVVLSVEMRVINTSPSLCQGLSCPWPHVSSEAGSQEHAEAVELEVWGKKNDCPALRERAKREGQVWVLARSPLSVGGSVANLAKHRLRVPLNR